MEISTVEYQNQALEAIKVQDAEGVRQAISSDVESAVIVYADAIENANESKAAAFK